MSKPDRTGETLTPEQASKDLGIAQPTQEEVETKAKADAEVTAQVDAKAAEDAKAKADAGAKAEADATADKDEAEVTTTTEALPKKRSIYDEYKAKKADARASKEKADELQAENERLTAIIEAGKKAETKSEKKEVADDIAEFAESIGADPEAIEKLEAFMKKRIANADGAGITKEDVEFVKKFQAERAQTQAQDDFKKEWSALAPSIKKEFPGISDADLASVEKAIDKIAHSEGFNDKELDYIYFKKKTELAKLISPKRPTFESGGNARENEGGDAQVELSGRSTPMDVMAAQSQDRRPESLEIRKGE